MKQGTLQALLVALTAVLLLVLPPEAGADSGASRSDRPEQARAGSSLHLAREASGNGNATKQSGEDLLIEELSKDYGPAEKPDSVADPLEPLNRVFFQFNDTFYLYVMDPVARGYAATVPEPWRVGLSNAFYNVRYPGRFVNNLLQGRVVGAFRETGRFLINTVFGFGGLLKPAKGVPALNPQPQEQDTGLTLGTWGVGHGVYIVWPFLGPSTARGTAGMVGDYFLDPLSYLDAELLSYSLQAGERVNRVSLRLGEYQDLKEGALDPYTALKDVYIQHRRSMLEE
jgi:phospholipid-binding lipoprotein MlaA